jgi:hypothetical protein
MPADGFRSLAGCTIPNSFGGRARRAARAPGCSHPGVSELLGRQQVLRTSSLWLNVERVRSRAGGDTCEAFGEIHSFLQQSFQSLAGVAGHTLDAR